MGKMKDVAIEMMQQQVHGFYVSNIGEPNTFAVVAHFLCPVTNKDVTVYSNSIDNVINTIAKNYDVSEIEYDYKRWYGYVYIMRINGEPTEVLIVKPDVVLY